MASPTHRGWKFDADNERLAAQYNGTEVFDFDANDFAVAVAASFASTLETTGAATLASATTQGNHTFSLTITAGADGVGADGEQLTSGGAAAQCDWSAAGSLREFKNLFRKREDADAVLQMLVETPVYDFQYKSKAAAREEGLERITSTGDIETVYTGIVADEAPWAMHHGGRILNPINTFGYLLLGIKALAEKVESLEAELATRPKGRKATA